MPQRLLPRSRPRQPISPQTPALNRAGAPVTHQFCLTDRRASGGSNMRIRRYLRSVSAFLTQLGAALLKAVVMSMVFGLVIVSVMRYMGVPVRSAEVLLLGVSRLAHILS